MANDQRKMVYAQRKMVYAQRDGLLDTFDVSETITDFCTEVVNTLIDQFIPPESLEEQWDVKGQEYKREAFELFSQMLVEIKHKAIRINSHVQVQQEDHTEGLERQRREELARQMRLEHQDAAAGIAEEVTGITEVVNEPVANHEPVVREGRKIGRNEPCPCGSGKKYKQCCGKINIQHLPQIKPISRN